MVARRFIRAHADLSVQRDIIRTALRLVFSTSPLTEQLFKSRIGSTRLRVTRRRAGVMDFP
jgi:hypothetical protein